jgi:hypothetical protein
MLPLVNEAFGRVNVLSDAPTATNIDGRTRKGDISNGTPNIASQGSVLYQAIYPSIHSRPLKTTTPREKRSNEANNSEPR